jgi:hypothetical protein
MSILNNIKSIYRINKITIYNLIRFNHKLKQNLIQIHRNSLILSNIINRIQFKKIKINFLTLTITYTLKIIKFKISINSLIQFEIQLLFSNISILQI